MRRRSIHIILTLFSLVLVSGTIALAQSSTSSETVDLDTHNTQRAADNTWRVAQMAPSKGKVFVVTSDQPDRKQTCHIQSFTLDKLVCSRAVGGPRTYLPQQVVALILPGNAAFRRRVVLGFNAGLGAAIWGTVVLAPVCPLCAVATGIQAFFFFGGAATTLICDYKPDQLLYLAPGQQLSKKLGFVQS